ncbi:PAS domain S-box protein [Massilia sp. UMI-21]|nr:PAS domain S-box protein [Massilia sp. UMI-21]
MPGLRRVFKGILPSGLSGYMALASSGLSIILTVVLVTLVQKQAIEHVKQNIGYGLGELAQQTADKLDRGMFERYREVNLVARRIAELDPRTQADKRRRMLDDAVQTYGYYSWFGLAAPDGTVLAAARGLLEGANVAQRPWFAKALQGIHIGDVHEAVKLASLLESPKGQPLRFVDVAFPVLGPAGAPVGVLGAHLSWEWARDVERSVILPIQSARQVQALITSAEGVVLLGPPDLLGQKLEATSLDQARGRKGVGYALETWPDGKKYLVGYSQTTGYAEYPGLGWVVLLRQEVDNAYAPVRALSQNALWTGVSLALLFSLAGALVANWITHPIKQLQQYADRIRKGESPASAPNSHGYDEVHSLASALNTLLDDLLRRSRQLESLNETLEQRVAERTDELAGALGALRQNAERIQTIVETAHDAFIGMDRMGVVTDWNTQAERLLGWTRREAVGRALGPLVLPRRYQPGFERMLDEFRRTGSTRELTGRIERTLVARDGQERTIELSVGLAGEDGRGFFSIFMRDVSSRKRIDQMKNELVATVSHELRTPLTSIRASLSLLNAGAAGEMDADARELIEIAYRHCERLVRMVNDMLDIEKLASGKLAIAPAPVPLLPVVRDALAAIRVQAAEAGVSLETRWEPALESLVVEMDRDRITQVLLNLLSNAVKFAPRGSAVEVSISNGAPGVRVSVADRGAGIPAAFRDRIFQRFAQGDPQADQKTSSGLGLAISRQIVVEHGGQLGFADRKGGGTVFHMDLPLLQDLHTVR